jgi:hypothetical protein
MARPTKEEVQKRDAAKKRVDELFGSSVKIDIKNVTKVADKISELQSEGGGNQWLEDQVTVLSDKNKQLEDDVLLAKENYNKLLESKGGVGAPTATVTPTSDSDVQKGVRKIFDDLRNNYEGKNQNQTKYEDAKIKVLLEQFLKTFPFLVEGMKRIR